LIFKVLDSSLEDNQFLTGAFNIYECLEV
jgi:hypothetical protein